MLKTIKIKKKKIKKLLQKNQFCAGATNSGKAILYHESSCDF